MKRELRDAAKSLLWEGGYAAMSPRRVLDASGAGQGSLYHHYRGKRHLAEDALKEIEDEMTAIAHKTFDPTVPPLDRIRAYLLDDRDGRRGCRLGRLVSETEVIDEPSLRAPIARYFGTVRKLLIDALAEAEATGTLKPGYDTVSVADAIVASIQGGFLLSRAEGDGNRVRSAGQGMVSMLEALRIHPL
ncbi:TetR/AcrR family transcriptional regulator [Brevundimonas bacteroides]|uniref:TetR/AcrR family transcriptional regulator n=1 Tax=Brevundimonas bacteroides TaxID=74311 RepID=UPI00138DFD67|nr:TetR/AcrR family transcriptional regulator [Brevundimonas bacteroides]